MVIQVGWSSIIPARKWCVSIWQQNLYKSPIFLTLAEKEFVAMSRSRYRRG